MDPVLPERGFDAIGIERAIAAELGRMDPAGNKQAVDAGTGGAYDVRAQAVADRQDAALVGHPEQAETAVVDRWVGFAVPPHATAEALILLRQGAGAESRLAVMHHDKVRIGAYHRQPAGERGVHDRRGSLERILPFGGDG